MKRTLKVLLLLTVALMLSIPSFAIQGDPTVIAFDDGALGHAVYAFAQSDSNTLVVNYGHHDLGACNGLILAYRTAPVGL